MHIGTDIVQIERIEDALARHGARFIDRLLTSAEQARLSHRPESLAGYWAAKESIAKALGTGIGAELGFHDILLDKTTSGAPLFALSTSAQMRLGMCTGSLSISHDGAYAIAVAALDCTDAPGV